MGVITSQNKVVSPKAIIAVFATAAIVYCGWYAASYFNQLQEDEVRVSASWGDVLNQYRRRLDLLPNVIVAVKTYAAHESDLLKDITESRSKVANINVTVNGLHDQKALGEFLAAQQQLSGQLLRLIMVAEKYPDLKANQLFQDLIIQLEGSENRIAYARQRYIGTIASYNFDVRRFPGNLIAKAIGFELKPDVNFGEESLISTVPLMSTK